MDKIIDEINIIKYGERAQRPPIESMRSIVDSSVLTLRLQDIGLLNENETADYSRASELIARIKENPCYMEAPVEVALITSNQDGSITGWIRGNMYGIEEKGNVVLVNLVTEMVEGLDTWDVITDKRTGKEYLRKILPVDNETRIFQILYRAN